MCKNKKILIRDTKSKSQQQNDTVNGCNRIGKPMLLFDVFSRQKRPRERDVRITIYLIIYH